MNRKSFYYHFRDKYDLIIWIYDTDFEIHSKDRVYTDIWEFLMNICCILEKRRKFYRKAFELSGENSLKSHFGTMLVPVIRDALTEKAEMRENTELYIDFIKDAFVIAIEKWINKKEAASPEIFAEELKQCLLIAEKMI
jgi:AcrR family transcriptional regulator